MKVAITADAAAALIPDGASWGSWAWVVGVGVCGGGWSVGGWLCVGGLMRGDE